MWPMLLDYSDDECRKILRKLELEAYASIISAFRAQGELTKEKKKMLQELSVALSISIERHRAEIRRAVNDEHLNTIADRIAGPNTTTDWAVEGRRVVPLMPRHIPQTAFTALANYAADAQASRNATLPVPSATNFNDGYHSDNDENIDHSRKRSSPMAHAIPEKFLMLDHSPINSTSCMDHEESNDLVTHSDSPIPQCVLQSVLGKDAGLFVKSSASPVIPKPLVSVPSAPSNKVTTTTTTPNTCGSTMLPLKSLSNPVSKTIPTSLSSLQSAKTCYSSSSFTAIESSQVSSSHESPFPNAASGSLFSTTCGFTQSPSNSSPIVTNSGVPRVQSKVLLTKPLMRPRLFTGSMLNTTSQTLSYQGSSPQLPTPSLVQPLHKTVSPLKSRQCSKVPPPIITSSSTSLNQTTTSSQVVPRVQSPITAMPRVTLSATTTNQIPSSLSLKQSQPPVALTTSTKSNVAPKMLSKPSTLRPPLGPRSVVASVTKPLVQKTSCVAVTTPAVRQPVPLSMVKTSVPSQLLSTTKSNSSLTYSSKVLQSPNQTKPVTQPLAKTIHYRNEGGLKIISQNLPSNRILPKPTSSLASQPSTSNPSRMITTTSAIGTARIVNFSQPINARFSRVPSSSSIAAVNLVNSLPVGGLRVALPVNNSMMRAALPAKPNVIVVHKAQVWPQAPGATIVMTSTGSLSRLSNEAIEEAVTIMQRQEAGRHPGPGTSFKTVTLHHGTPFTSAQNVNIQPKGLQAGIRKPVDQPHSEAPPLRPIDSVVSENKNKQLKTVTDESPPLSDSAENSISVPNKEAVNTSLTKQCTATIVSTSNRTAESSLNKNGDNIASNSIVADVVANTALNDAKEEGLIQKGDVTTEDRETQDADELLSHDGPLSNEVIKLLQQAGLGMEVSEQNSIGSKASSPQSTKLFLSESSLNFGSCVKTKEETNLNVCRNTLNTANNLQSESAEISSIETEDIGLLDIDESCDNQSQGTHEGKELVDPFLKCDAESNCHEDIFLPPVDSSDAEGSNEVPQAEKSELPSLQATESLGSSPTSQSLLSALVVNNVPVDMEGLDNGTLHLPLSPDNTVS